MHSLDVRTVTLSAEDITVVYFNSKALDQVSLELSSGRVHVLAGQNGAGKSTLIKALSGSLIPNGGKVLLGDTELALRLPADAVEIGIRVIPQELQLFPKLTVWENVTAGEFLGRLGFMDRRRLKSKAQAALRKLDNEIDLDSRVDDLTPAQQQRVMIAHALVVEAKFLILDEPTAALSRDERTKLLNLIRTLVMEGVGVLFVSHHLEESLAIGDDVSVLRDGKLVWTRPRADVTAASLTAAMFGETLLQQEMDSHKKLASIDLGRLLFSANSLRWLSRLSPLDIDVRAGEILGVAGLPGSGASTLNSALIGLLPRSGSINVEGTEVGKTVGEAIRSGLGIIPSDRKTQGLFMSKSISDNICASSLGRLSKLGWLRDRAMSEEASAVARDVQLKPPAVTPLVSSLSGGNQQKTLVGRWLRGNSKVLLADEPTRGVDVKSRAQIHDLLRTYVANGGACIVYSSDLQELVELSSKLFILRRDGGSQIVTNTVTPEKLYELMSEHSEHQARGGI